MHQELALVRTINQYIDSKTGSMLPLGKRRIGVDHWLKFEDLIIDILRELDISSIVQPEHPRQIDARGDFRLNIYCHKNRRDMPGVPSSSLFYMQMHKRTLFTLDKSGWGAFNSQKALLKQNASLVESVQANSFYDSFIYNIKKNRETKIQVDLAAQYLKLEKDRGIRFSTELPEKFYFVPLQVSRDYVIHNLSPISVVDFIKKIKEWSKSSPYPFVIKAHPFNLQDDAMIKLLAEVADQTKVFISNGHVFDLIERSQGVFLINSGVGFESMYFLKPVVIMGTSDYEDVVFKADLNSIQSSFDWIESFDDGGRTTYKKFLHYYFNNYAYDFELHPRERLKKYLHEQIRGQS